MNSIITSSYKHLLYKDEMNDPLLLTKCMEIYRYSDDILACSCWSKRIYLQLKKMGIIFNEWSTDEKLYTFHVDIANLNLLLATGSHSRRVSKIGRWLKNKEKRLGHRIFPFNPKLKP
jgi:hypothetical protein